MDYPFFQAFHDAAGDLYMLGGAAYQRSTGALVSLPNRGIPLGFEFSGAEPAITSIIPSFGAGVEPARAWNRQLFRAGGSGRNLILNSDDGGPTEWARIPRVFAPGPDEDTWTFGVWTITRTSASSAVLFDGSNPIAEMTSGVAPFGDYEATSYGESDYNDFEPFTITAISEAGVNQPQATLAVTGGLYPTSGIFATTDGITWTSDEHALSTLVVSLDGSAELRYDGDVIAIRPPGENPYSPGGEYVATAQGETDFNSGNPWTAIVTAPAIAPKVGWIYVMAHLSAGTLTELRGPYHALALPTPTADLQPIPIARSDGSGKVEQHHTGLIILSEGEAGAAGANAEIVVMADLAAYLALDPAVQMDGRWYVIPK